MSAVYLLTGSNLGERERLLAEAALKIEQEAGKIVHRSSLYETAPWGLTDQPSFLNQVLVINTLLQPQSLMERLLNIELEMGRTRAEKYGPRTIDIDILYYESTIVDLPQLNIPHPQIQFRRFVLTPLAEIAAEFIHPVLGKTNRELLSMCTDDSNVQKKLAE